MKFRRKRLLAALSLWAVLLFVSSVTPQITNVVGVRGVPQELEQVKKDIVVLKAEVTTLQAESNAMKTTVSDLQTEVAMLKSQMPELEAKIAQLVGDMVDILGYEKRKNEWDKAFVTNQPDGSDIVLRDDTKVPKVDCLTALDVRISDLEGRIAAYQ